MVKMQRAEAKTTKKFKYSGSTVQSKGRMEKR